MGLAPNVVQVNDLICVIVGCSVPMLLRRRGDNYVLISNMCLHGLMDGEAVTIENVAIEDICVV